MTPYTPEAIAHIRDFASRVPAMQIANELGWKLETLRERAHRHSIELINPNPMIETESKRPPVIRRLDTASNSPPTFQPRVTVDMTLDQIKAVLGPRQAEVLSALEITLRTRQPIRTCQIVSYCGARCTSSNICQIIRRIDQHLAITKWRIEFARFQRGGYRLVVRT